MLPAVPEPVQKPAVGREAAKAAASPTAIAAAAVGAGIGVLDHSAVVAVVLAVGLWAGRVSLAALAAARRRRAALRPRAIDPWAVPEPWRQLVTDAVRAGRRFDEVLARWPAGPLRERLAGVQVRFDAGVRQVWDLARQGSAMTGRDDGARADQLSAELERIQQGRQSGTEEAVAAQLRALRRRQAAARSAADRLRLLTSQLDEAVTALVELSVEETDSRAADAVAGSVESVMGEIEALRQALSESMAPGGGTPSPPARS